MKTSLLNSRRCSTANLARAGAALLFLCAITAQASVPPAQTVLQNTLAKDIQQNSSASFEKLLSRWNHDHGAKAVEPLLAIAHDVKNTDRTRYIAVMGAAKLGGSGSAEKLVPFLRDKIWMIRTASLRALAALKNPKTSKAVLPLLKDPALVVRMEAVDTVRELKPAGASRALVQVLQSQENYRFGRAQWVPQRALQALVALQDPTVVPELTPLLDHRKDPDLQLKTIAALESLTGRKMGNPGLTLPEKIDRWKKALAEDRASNRASTQP